MSEYAELHAKTNFSFLEGASHPEELVARAAELGYAGLAITDCNSLAGVVRAHGAAKDLGLKLLIGAEITPVDAPAVVLLATDRAAYGRLARLITEGRRRVEKGQCRLTFDDLARHSAGLLAGVLAADSDTSQSGDCPSFRGNRHRCEAVIDENGTGTFGDEGDGHILRRETVRRMPQSPACEALPNDPLELTLPDLHRYRELFGDRCHLFVELHHGADDLRFARRMLAWSRRTGVPVVAAGGACYHHADRKPLHDVLTATRYGCTVAEAGERLLPNAQRHLQPTESLRAIFAELPGAIERTLSIAARCTFSLDELRYEYPEELAPPGQTISEYLARLTWAGAAERYPQGIPPRVRKLVEHELQLIAELHYEAYFLTVWDLVRFARSRGILCQGRGSAANSVVCFCLGITSVDPERIDLLFERFISRERGEAPDIDVDFEHERREEVLQYLYEKYGRERAGMTAEVITYRPRSAVRDVGKALGFSLDRVDALAKRIEHFREEPEMPQRLREVGIDPDSRAGRQLAALVSQLIGFPRHLSQHTGGMVMTRGPLCELVPIENAAMPERTVIQWNKDDLDELGILKVDCLCLGMLTAIRKCFDMVAKHHGRRLTLAGIPEGDKDVYRMICRADTMGVFQIESRAQMSMLPRLRPRCFYDLVIEVAIVRPGPIQGNMVHPYLRRRDGLESVEFPNETMREVLGKTLGVPLFQEQAMRLAVVAAGFTPGEADQLRRAMGAWRRPGVIDQFRRKLLEGMRARGFSQEFAESVFTQIRGFGDYGFPESHAASFALLVYVSAWLKCHYPAAFTAALINSQPMGFYAPAQLVRNAREHGVPVLPVDVNHSDWDCTLEAAESAGGTDRSATSGRSAPGLPASEDRPGPGTGSFLGPCRAEQCACPPHHSPPHRPMALRLGLRMISGFSEAHAQEIMAARRAGPFASVEDFAARTRVPPAVIARLAKAAAFESMRLTRRTALWDALAQDRRELPLFEKQDGSDTSLQVDGNSVAAVPEQTKTVAAASPKKLPQLTDAEEVLADYRTLGLSLRAHPLSFLRQEFERMKITPARDLATWPQHRPIRVAGIVLVRQRPSTAKGITFVTLEDETGVVNLIIRPDVWRRFRSAAMGATLMLAAGRLQRHRGVIHVLVTRLENVSEKLAGLGTQSRDFH